MKSYQIKGYVDEIMNKACIKLKSGMNFIVGISGIDCSGKSSSAEIFSHEFSNHYVDSYIISGDDFLFDKKTRYSNPEQEIGYYSETFDYKLLFNELLIPLSLTKDYSNIIKQLDWQKDIYINKHYNIHGPCIIIVEGVFLFKKSLPNIFDYKIWIDITFEEGMKRALNRQRDIEYYKDKNVIIEKYTNRFFKAQKLHIDTDKPMLSCDLIL